MYCDKMPKANILESEKCHVGIHRYVKTASKTHSHETEK